MVRPTRWTRSSPTDGMPNVSPLERQLSLFEPAGSSTRQQPELDSVPEATDVEAPTEPTVGERRLALRRQLAKLLDAPVVSLVLTRNRRRMLSAKPEERGLAVRLHRCFLGAPEPVLDAVAQLCNPGIRGRRRKQALAVAREHFAHYAGEHMKPARKMSLRPQGSVYDLLQLRDRVEAEYFDGDLNVDITWGQGGWGNADLRRGGIHIRLGSYDSTHRLVRIHPVLDREEVPEFVVESVVHHEMLHAAEPPRPGRLRRIVHTRAFRRREREFRDYEKAERWIEKNLRRLARWRRQLI